MSRTSNARRRWSPESEKDAEKVRESLHAIVSTTRFASSKRYPALLQYVVEKTLIGEAESLKERTIGIEVFSRPFNYDTGADTVVRYTAGEVRKRLSLYYHEDGADSPIQIELPAGSYVPEFYLKEVEEEPASSGLDPLLTREPVEAPEYSLAVRETQSPAATGQKAGVRFRRWAFLFAAVALVAGVALWVGAVRNSSDVFDAFWAPLRKSGRTAAVLISPSAVVFSSNTQTGVDPAQNLGQDAVLSPETALAMSRISDLLGADNVPFIMRLPVSVSDDDLVHHSAVLIGAYNNKLALQATQGLRYRFSNRDDQSIYDATQPSVFWARPRSWKDNPGNDYALVARVQNPVTHQWTYVVAGLGRAGTVAASAMIASPTRMAALANRLPRGWASENLELVLRVEVRSNQTTVDPVVEATAVWK